MKHAAIVFWKEVRETFRDRRVILGVFVSPLLITPLLASVVIFFMMQKVQHEQEETLTVAIVGETELPTLADKIRGNESLRVEVLNTRESAETAIRERSVRAALVIPTGAGALIADGGKLTVTLLVDQSNEKSRTARGRLDRAVRRWKDDEINRRLEAQQLDRMLIDPIVTEDVNLATEQKTGGSILAFILPYVIILNAAFGAITSAFDLCAGEKERGTMETLLVSPASRRDIILGKLAATFLVSAVATICSIIGLLGILIAGATLAPLPDLRVAFSLSSILAMLVVVVPLSLMTSSLLLVLSTFARNQKEAQAWLFPFMMLILLPAMLSFVFGPENRLELALVPVLNTALVMKQVLTGVMSLPFIALAAVASLAYAALAMGLVLAMFQRESILFRT